MVTPFAQTVRRQTEVTCIKRNRVVSDMSVAVLVVHAAPDSKIEALCRELLATGKPVHTFAHPANEAMIEAGARPIAVETDWAKVLQ
jgi:predicted Rossmann fold nucleotide-binding protein DprA/Smf involved in DNA uptake